MNRTGIEWCDYTWNPLVGCTGPMGDGKHCAFCYAKRFARRQKCELCRAFTPHAHWVRLEQPEHVKRPSRVFVCSMGDPADFANGAPNMDLDLSNVISVTWNAQWQRTVCRSPE